MFSSLIQVAGLWFVIGCALMALAAFSEQAGAARLPGDERPRHGAVTLLSTVTSLLTPGLLLAHGFLSTHGQVQIFRAITMGLPVAVVLLGTLMGAAFGAGVKGAVAPIRLLALPLDMAALAVAIYATRSSIRTLIEAAQNGGLIVVTP